MKKVYLLLFLFILYSLTLGIRIYWLPQKDGLNVDEGLSVTLACYNDYMWTSNYEFNREYSGKELKEISLCDNDSFKIMLLDIYHLWRNNRDDPHTNLYYSFLRLSLTGLKTGEIKPIIFRGVILNLFFFTISFVFFFLLMRLLFPASKLLQFSATVCAFLSTATISNTLFLRPYQIQETMFIVFCYYFFKTLDLKKHIVNDGRLYINTRLIFSLSLVTAFTLLTGYYSIIFIGLFGTYIVFTNCKKRDYPEIKFYILVLCLGFLLAQAFYSQYLRGYLSGRSLQAPSILFSGFFTNIKLSVIFAVALLHKHFFTWSIIVVCALCLTYLAFLKFRKHKFLIQRPAFYILAVSMLYYFIIMLIAPYKILRYVMPVFPFLIILPVMMLDSIGKKKITAIAILFLCTVFLKNALNQNNIENLYRNKPDEYYFSRDVDIPVFILNKSLWKYADLIPYFNDKQVYYFIDNYGDIQLIQYEKFYLILEEALEAPDIDLAQFKMEKESSIGYLVCREYVNTEPFHPHSR
jgi:hypothetical protein